MPRLPKFKHIKWVKYWSGRWSLLTCSYFGHQYTNTLGEQLGFAFPHTLLIIHDGQSACYMDEKELIKFRKYLAAKIVKDSEIGYFWCNQLKQRADEILGTIAELKHEPATPSNYSRFIHYFYQYVGAHLFVKNAPEFLPEKLLRKMLPAFTESRMHAEKVYTETEEYMYKVAADTAKKEKLEQKSILCLTKEELSRYFELGRLPPSKTLTGRNRSAAFLFEKGKYELLVGKQADEIENIAHKLTGSPEVYGKAAYPGKATGTARIILDPRKKQTFNEGDILIAGMTRPEYIQFMKKAGAIVTDAGGILCHAAIVARELKKPCVIGTERATKTFKNGDKIEVDAGKGAVRKI